MNLKKQFLFTKKLESFYKAGRPLLEIFNSLAANEPSLALRKSFSKVAEEIRAGSSLAAALEKHDDILDVVYAKLIMVGEKSGRLDVVLNQILELQRALIALHKKIISASLYPIAIVATYLFVFSILIFFMIPAITDFMIKFNFDPPFFLMWVAQLKGLCCSPLSLCACPFAIALITIAIYIFINIDFLAGFRSIVMLYIPGFGRLEKLKNMYAYFFTMKVCYESGLSALEATELSTHNITNDHLFDRYAEINEYVNEGDNISSSLNKSNLFDFDIIDLVRVGEESGRLEESYKEIIELLDDKIKTTVAIMIAMVKPLGIVFGLLFLLGVFGTVFLIVFSAFMKIKEVLPH